MDIKEIPVDGYEKVMHARDTQSGLNAFIAVHSTVLGPALGGLRIWPYESEDEALTDVLRLARGMTYKSAIAHTGLGGGKSVVLLDPRYKTEALFKAMGRFIDRFEGTYITAEDVNTTIEDLEVVATQTRYVTGLSRESGSSGNPSPYTAHGCFLGIKACIERVFGSDSLTGRKVAILGTGAVGSALVRKLVADGAEVWANDLREDRVQALVDELGIHSASKDEVLTMECDVLAPCALGGVLNDDTIPKLGCKIVAGAANNQLLARRHGDDLRARGILYAPDFVINAGGIINVGCELLPGGYNEEVSLSMIRRIPQALHEIFDIVDREDVSTASAAYQLAETIVAAGKVA